jgi:hypothetical protein
VTVTGALAFYQALQIAFEETLQRHAGQAFCAPALVGQAFDAFERNATGACAGEPPPACSRGCDACCTLRVRATAPEVLLVARFLRMVQIDLVARVHAADALTCGRTESERVARRQPCPFAAQGVCVIYSVRPLACRAHLSFDASAAPKRLRASSMPCRTARASACCDRWCKTRCRLRCAVRAWAGGPVRTESRARAGAGRRSRSGVAARRRSAGGGAAGRNAGR